MQIKEFLKKEFDLEVDDRATFAEVSNLLSARDIQFKSSNARRRKRIKTKKEVCEYLVKEIKNVGYTQNAEVKNKFPEIYSRYLDVKHVAAGGDIARISFPAIFNVADAFKIKVEFVVESKKK